MVFKINRALAMVVMSLCFLSFAAIVVAYSPSVISYQGVLTESGIPVDGEERILKFDLFSSETSTTVIWTETHTVTPSNGQFDVLLGDNGSPMDASLFDGNAARWLAITIIGGEEFERFRFVSSPYSLRVQSIDDASGGTITGDLRVTSGNITTQSVTLTANTVDPFTLSLVIASKGDCGPPYPCIPFPDTLVLLQGNDVAGGHGEFRDANGQATIELNGQEGGNDGGYFRMRKGDGTTTVLLRSDVGGSDGGGRLNLYAPNGETRATLEASEGATGGAQLILTNAVGDTTIELDADWGGGGEGRIVMRDMTGAKVIEIGAGLDYAEAFPFSCQGLEPGMVVVIDPSNPDKLCKSAQSYDKCVAGIVAGANGLPSGIQLGNSKSLDDQSVALAGRVYCLIDASYGEVNPGDLLTTSPTPGYAMIVSNYMSAQGAIIGKAMETLAAGETGLVLVLVTLQ